MDPFMSLKKKKENQGQQNRQNQQNQQENQSVKNLAIIFISEYVLVYTKILVKSFYEFVSFLTTAIYEVGTDLYKYLLNVPPDDPEEFSVWQKAQEEKQKNDALQKKLNARKDIIEDQYKLDKNKITSQQKICENWSKDTITELNKKKDYESSLHVKKQNRERPERTDGWFTEPFNNEPYQKQLCEELGCSNSKKLKLPEIGGTNSKKCIEENIKLNHFEHELQMCQEAQQSIAEYYQNRIDEMKNRCNSPGLLTVTSSEVAVIGSKPLESMPTISIPNQQQTSLNWLDKLLSYPIEIAKGTKLNMSQDTHGIWHFIVRLSECFISIFVCIGYLVILALCSVVLYFTITYTYSSIKHWSENRREQAAYEKQQNRLEHRYKRRKKRYKEFGRRVDNFLEGTGKKSVELFKTLRGGYIVPNLCEIDFATLTEYEKDQLLFLADPIHAIIKLEKIRKEMEELLDTSEQSKIFKSVKIKRPNKFKLIINSISLRLASFYSLKDKASAGLGSIVLIVAIMSSSVPVSTYQYNTQSATQIVKVTNSYFDLTSEEKFDVEKLEEFVEDIEEIIEMDIAIKKAEPRNNKRKMKEKKYNRRIHTLKKFENDQVNSADSVDEDSYRVENTETSSFFEENLRTGQIRNN